MLPPKKDNASPSVRGDLSVPAAGTASPSARDPFFASVLFIFACGVWLMRPALRGVPGRG
ncbi:MAG: hypothetical protein BSOLF_0837 [Candidatus Carbobacillus altaicus]|uniref:Uncharacterized protein n=1 Tax=Candidatus Carbonibacillus altaicus TaxID=2163959 RepID=A0A2R6Y095_9BACL|nr:MAG: hypothetical protein BSOLF_0837 [Candidatus Carbobacillus altaicus]